VSEENVEIYRSSIDGWNRGSIDEWLAAWGPESEFHLTGLFPGFDRVYRGPEGARKFWGTLREPFEYISVSVERTIDLGDRVVGLLNFEAKGKESAVPVSLRYGHVATFENRVVTRLDGYASWNDALEAAGLADSQK
jgi:ketosteroid isomerase-like protein